MDIPTDPTVIKEFLWVINKIETERQITPKGDVIKYQIPEGRIASGIPTSDHEYSVIRILAQEGIIKATEINENYYDPNSFDPYERTRRVRVVEMLNLERFKELREMLLSGKTEGKLFDTKETKKAQIAALKKILEKNKEKEDIKREVIEGLQGNQRDKADGIPHTLVKDGKGYFKFYKQSENILIGGTKTRHFRFLQSLCVPTFGVQKTIEGVFEAIRLLKDSKDSRLVEWNQQKKTRMLEIITNSGIKELQKNKKLQKKLRYRFDAQKKNMWLELED